LMERNKQPDLFQLGDYLPLPVKGRYSEHVLAFAWRHGQQWYVIAIPLGLALLCTNQQKEPLELDWQDTRISLPADAPDNWHHCMLPTAGQVNDDLFGELPLALLRLEKTS
jgi:(1->4)-alpha-D-glucan 1-alpha-D-glucosylmutase